MQISTNIASLQANQTFLNTSANNIANVNTDGFIPQDTRITNSANTPVADTRATDGNDSAKSQTDLSKEIPDQIVAGEVAEANVSAIKTQDEMFGTLLDIKA
jgi:flagellar hook protein FlgE